MIDEKSIDMESVRYLRGLEILRTLDPLAKDAFDDLFSGIAPDMSRLIVDVPFGEIYARPGLSLRDRQISTISALTALGTAPLQLKIHIRGGLNAGCEPHEIIEIMMQMAIYAGFPAAINAIRIAKEVFEERGLLTSAAKHGD